MLRSWLDMSLAGTILVKLYSVCFYENTHNLEITMVMQRVSMLFSFFMSPDKKKEHLAMPLVSACLLWCVCVCVCVCVCNVKNDCVCKLHCHTV